jgi:hypothetical protein
MGVKIENLDNIAPGTVAPFPHSKVPVDGWLICNGAVLNKNMYLNLFDKIGTTYGGSGDFFNLPNFSGRFLRGYGTDPADPNRYSGALGTYQDDGFKNHTHGGGRPQTNYDGGTGSGANAYWRGPTMDTGGASVGSIPNETRPVNMAVIYCIKY